MNKKFLECLQERQNTFQLLDLSIEDEKENEEELDDQPKDEDDEASDEDLKPKTKFKADALTKYLQYVTASD